MAEFLYDRIPLLILLLIGTAFTFVWTMLMKDRLHFKWYAAAPLALLHTVAGVASVMAFARLENIGRTATPGLMSLFGAIFFLPLFYFLLARLSKRKIADVFDIFTVSMAFTLLCARINCILSGCCLGAFISGTDGMRWPTRETELVFYVVILTVLILRIRKKKNYGEIFPLYMVCYGAFRFVIEFFREPGAGAPLFGVLHVSHIWATLSVCLGLSIYYEIQRKHTKHMKGAKKK